MPNKEIRKRELSLHTRIFLFPSDGMEGLRYYPISLYSEALCSWVELLWGLAWWGAKKAHRPGLGSVTRAVATTWSIQVRLAGRYTDSWYRGKWNGLHFIATLLQQQTLQNTLRWFPTNHTLVDISQHILKDQSSLLLLTCSHKANFIYQKFAWTGEEEIIRD